MSIKSKEEELAFAIIWKVLEEEGKKAEWSTVRLRSFSYAVDIFKKYGVDVSGLIPRVMEKFRRNKKTGEILLPKVISPPLSPDQIAREIGKGIKRIKGPPEDVVAAAARYQDLQEKMRGVDDYLANWNSSPSQVIGELFHSTKKIFFNKYENPAATFEFVVAKAFCTLFQIPLYIEYNAPFFPREEKCVIWRGGLENYKPKVHAPGGASDIVLFARGPYYLTIESTLRYSPRQWKEEIEPVFRHVKKFVEENDLGAEDVFLVFIVAQEIHKETYEWLHARSEEFKVVALNAENLSKIVKASLFTFSLTHAEIRRLLDSLYRRVTTDYSIALYIRDLKTIVDDWCRSLLEPNLSVFVAVKAYECLLKRRKLSGVMEISNELAKDEEVKDYMQMIGKEPSDIKRRTRDWIHQLSILGLAREINGYLKALPIEEFENKALKTYGHIIRMSS